MKSGVNMKSSEILREARALIADGSLVYVCNAVKCIGYTYPAASPEKAHRIVNYIQNVLIYPHGTLEFWLEANHGLNVDKIINARKMLQTRLAWIDWMIDQYESIGD